MKPILYKLLGRLGDLVDVQPVIALFMGSALLAVFLTVLLRPQPQPEPNPNLHWTLYRHLTRLLWASLMVSVLLASLALMRVYLHQTLAGFQRTHGRVTQANYNAVQTIWGPEQEQGERRQVGPQKVPRRRPTGGCQPGQGAEQGDHTRLALASA